MIVITNTGGIVATNSFLVADETTGDAVIFDAPNDTVGPLLDEVERRKWNLKGLWLTHGHFDHTADHAVVTERFPDSKLMMHKLEEKKIQHPKSAVITLPFKIPARDADGYFEDGEETTIGTIPVRVMHTPGHSEGHIVFFMPTEKTLIVGDLILMNTVGRTDLPGSNHADLLKSLKKVMALPPDTVLLAGHGHESTIGQEAKLNPYVQDLK